VSEDQEQLAQRLLARGREQLEARLRPAFEQAAAAHGDELAIEPGTIEQMVQRAVEHADGALWRRSLAAAAREELGLELGDALIHPAVQRAHELAGAPPYHPTATPGDSHVATTPDEIVAALGAEAEAAAGAAASPAAGPEPELTPQAIRLPAVHLGGIGNLSRGETSLELRLSDLGIDIVRSDSSSTLGRLEWSEIEALEIPRARGRRRRRTRAQLLVRTSRGEAHFEVPGVSEAELRNYVEPLFAANRG
jgi:hypothetical protein